jgi:hypothetical protein
MDGLSLTSIKNGGSFVNDSKDHHFCFYTIQVIIQHSYLIMF